MAAAAATKNQLNQPQIMTGDIIATVKKSSELFGVGWISPIMI